MEIQQSVKMFYPVAIVWKKIQEQPGTQDKHRFSAYVLDILL